MTQADVIVAKGLTKSYGELEVLKGIDLSIRRGSVFALLGPNGAGKTTTVRILATLLLPDGGQAMVDGFDVVTQADEVRQVIGLTGQYAAVDEYLSGRENLIMMGRLYRLSKAQATRRADQLLEQFDLVAAGKRVVKNYSGGMRRRLDLATSLIAVPPVIFLDEPTTGLDPRSRLAMWQVIEGLVSEGTTILLTTQYLDEADRLADRIAVIDHGKVIAEGTADELKAHVGSERLDLTVAQGSDFAKAVEVAGEGVNVDEKHRLISIANEGGVPQLKAMLTKMESAQVEIEGLSLHKPTLDDVFLELTGRQAEPTTQPDDQQEGAA